jgi:hypothetical protein
MDVQGMVVSLQARAREEWQNTAKREANLRLAKAFAVFFGSIVVFRQYGEVLFAA